MPIEFRPHRRAAPAPPPATVTGANDGVSLNGTIVQLGNAFGNPANPGKLIDDRHVYLNSFRLEFDGNLIDTLLDDTNGQAYLQDASGLVGGYFMDFVNQVNYLGDVNFVNPVIQITGNLFGDSLAYYYLQDQTGNRFIDSSWDTGSMSWFLELDNGPHNSKLSQDMTSISWALDGNNFLSVDTATDTYYLGDLAGTGPVAHLDANEFFYESGAVKYLDANVATQLYTFGDPVNGPFLHMDNTTPLVQILGSIGVNPIAEVFRFTNAGGSAFFSMGDRQVFANGTFIEVDDGAGQIIINNSALNSKVKINNVLGFTGTVSPVNSITVNGGIVTAVS